MQRSVSSSSSPWPSWLGYYQAIYVAPEDAAQGEIFRIIFYHVPSASVAFTFFGSRFSAPSAISPSAAASPSTRRFPMRGHWLALKSAWFSAPWCC